MREVFIWSVRKIFGWLNLLWNKIKMKRDEKQQLKSQAIADLRLKRKIKRAKIRMKMQERSIDETDTPLVHESVTKSQHTHVDNQNSIDNTALYQNIKNKVMQPQHKDAKMRLERPAYWLDTGLWVSLAIDKIEEAIDIISIKRNPDPEVWLRKVIGQVEMARDKFRNDYEDPDGFGIATFHEVVRALDELVGKTNQTSLKKPFK